jgi:hypothetical protein
MNNGLIGFSMAAESRFPMFGCFDDAAGIFGQLAIQNTIGDELTDEIRAFVRKNVLKTLPARMFGGRMSVNKIEPFSGH